MPTVSYPYDPTGTAITNLVVDERQVLTAINADPYRFFVPLFAPFYTHNLNIIYKDPLTGVETTMVEGRDYNPIVPYMSASRALGKPIYAGICWINDNINGEVFITYQCLGGEYSADRNYVVNNIAEHNYNPRLCSWDQLTNIQCAFPPEEHPQDIDTFTGLRDLLTKCDEIRDAIASKDHSAIYQLVMNHILDLDDPHKTLRLIQQHGGLTKEEVEALIAQAMAIHTNPLGDPHPQYLTQARGDARYLNQTQPDSTTTVKGITRYSTNAEAIDGTNSTSAVTPVSAAAALAFWMSRHTDPLGDPHVQYHNDARGNAKYLQLVNVQSTLEAFQRTLRAQRQYFSNL